MDFRWYFIWDNAGYLLLGVPVALGLSVASILTGLVIGMIAALLRASPVLVLRASAAAYIDIYRSVPMLVHLYLVFFGLASLGPRLDPLPAAFVALSLYAGAYSAEILRAGIEVVPRGQILAGRSIGLSEFQTFRLVVLPQAVRNVMPPLGSQFIETTKGSSLASLVGVSEIAQRGLILTSETFRPFETYLAVAVIYLGLTAALVQLISFVERQIGVRRRNYDLPLDFKGALPTELLAPRVAR